MSDILSENENIVSESSLESSKEVVIKNKEHSQTERTKRKLTEKQRLAFCENIKKANQKRRELKPVNEQARSDKQDLKTLEKLVRAKEMASKKNELMKRLAELDAEIEGAKKVVYERKKQKARAVEDQFMDIEPSVDEVVVKRPKKKVRKIIVEETPSETEEVVVKKQRKPRAKKEVDKQKELGNMALKQAIEKEQTKLLYNQIFG